MFEFDKTVPERTEKITVGSVTIHGLEVSIPGMVEIKITNQQYNQIMNILKPELAKISGIKNVKIKSTVS